MHLHFASVAEILNVLFFLKCILIDKHRRIRRSPLCYLCIL